MQSTTTLNWTCIVEALSYLICVFMVHILIRPQLYDLQIYQLHVCKLMNSHCDAYGTSRNHWWGPKITSCMCMTLLCTYAHKRNQNEIYFFLLSMLGRTTCMWCVQEVMKLYQKCSLWPRPHINFTIIHTLLLLKATPQWLSACKVKVYDELFIVNSIIFVWTSMPACDARCQLI